MKALVLCGGIYEYYIPFEEEFGFVGDAQTFGTSYEARYCPYLDDYEIVFRDTDETYGRSNLRREIQGKYSLLQRACSGLESRLGIQFDGCAVTEISPKAGRGWYARPISIDPFQDHWVDRHPCLTKEAHFREFITYEMEGHYDK